MLARFTGWLLGLDRVASVDRVRPGLGAEWATRDSGLFWLCLATAAIILLVSLFYLRYQRRGPRRMRILLAAARTLLLLLLLLTLAEPLVRVTLTRLERPVLFVVFDGTASMGLRDHYDPVQQTELGKATGLQVESGVADRPPTRQDYVAAWLSRAERPGGDASLLAQLDASDKCELRVFVFDGRTESRVQQLSGSNGPDETTNWSLVADQLTCSGQVTGLGTVLRDLGRQVARRRLSGVIMVSDFVQNSGEHPLSESDPTVGSPLKQLGVPIYAVGVGAERGKDLAVSIHPDVKVRRGEQTNVSVRLRHSDLDGEVVRVRLLAQTRSAGREFNDVVEVASREVTLAGSDQLMEIPFVPDHAGEIDLCAEATVVPGETVTENNRATRRIRVIDDFIRLLYVAYEPTWEWRFIKEVFHRDPAVGLRGFRTYLASSDPRVRQSNPLFLPTLTQSPSEFFATDVVFLDDLPQTTLTPRFCSMVERFVRDLGGGLVVIAGPRFGPQQLLNTPVAKMLPVIIDPKSRIDDQREFALQLSPRASEFPFMQLDEDPELNRKAWQNLGRLPWYQPVANKHERAIVLAHHPTDLCLDGRTPQPLIAVRRYGAGEVVYVGFNETWRLRRKYGDKYYRRFWLPIIDRLGLSHALGARKRFVVRVDRSTYRIDDEVIATVQAYDQDYRPLEPGALEGESLSAELLRSDETGQPIPVQTIHIGSIRSGVFETRFPVLDEGTYQIRVQDPITQDYSEQSFTVTGASAEMRGTVRDAELARRLGEQSHGASCALEEANTLTDRIKLEPLRETEEHFYAIWTTPAWFTVVILLMLGEWLLRKWINLV